MPDAKAGTAETSVAIASVTAKLFEGPAPDWYPPWKWRRTITIGTATSATAYISDHVASARSRERRSNQAGRTYTYSPAAPIPSSESEIAKKP